jgi:hypothetical protein
VKYLQEILAQADQVVGKEQPAAPSLGDDPHGE